MLETVLARLGLLHLGCTREAAALLRWLLTLVSLYVVLACNSLNDYAMSLSVTIVTVIACSYT